MKTIEEVKEHFLTNHYRPNSLKTIALFLSDIGLLDSPIRILSTFTGDKTFVDFVQWFEQKELVYSDNFIRMDSDGIIQNVAWCPCESLIHFLEKELEKIAKEEVKKQFGTFPVNPFDCCNCTCTSSKYNVEDYFKKNDEDVTDEVVCTELESIVDYLEDMDNLPIHLQRVNETLKLLIDSIEQHKK